MTMNRTAACLNIVFRTLVPYFNLSCRHAGHSKWQNIRHIKADKDAQKSALFARFSRQIRVAVTEGNSADPLNNARLSNIIELAKKANMPIASINNVIKSAQNETERTEPQVVEVKGPGGSAFILFLLTGNFTKAKSQLNIIFRKSKGGFAVGSIVHLFECKGIIETEFPPNSCLEDAINTAVEIDIEEVIEVGDLPKNLQFICEPSLVHKIKTQLESRKYKVHLAEIQYEPHTRVDPQTPHLEKIKWFYEKLQELPDIEEIYDNVEWPEES